MPGGHWRKRDRVHDRLDAGQGTSERAQGNLPIPCSQVLASASVARFSLSALGVDRPGIVAAVSGALVDQGCNLEDSTMTILQGHFAILLVISAPPGMTVEQLESALEPAAGRLDLVVAVRDLGETEKPSDASDVGGSAPDTMTSWSVSVYGADRPGIVHQVANALADAGANIVDLATHLIGEPDAPVYVMVMRVLLPQDADDADVSVGGGADVDVAERLKESVSGLGVHCMVHRDDPDLL